MKAPRPGLSPHGRSICRLPSVSTVLAPAHPQWAETQAGEQAPASGGRASWGLQQVPGPHCPWVLLPTVLLCLKGRGW